MVTGTIVLGLGLTMGSIAAITGFVLRFIRRTNERMLFPIASLSTKTTAHPKTHGYGELGVCPFCGQSNTSAPSGKLIVKGSWLRQRLTEHPDVSPDTCEDTFRGVSTPVRTTIGGVDYLWQGCVRCCGQWYTLPFSRRPTAQRVGFARAL